MVRFDNELDIARDTILHWPDKNIIKQIIISRDVFGKLFILIDSNVYPDDSQRMDIDQRLHNRLKEYYSGKTYWEQMPKKEKKYLDLMFKILKNESVLWTVEEAIPFYVTERPIAKKAWAAFRYRQNPVWSYEAAVTEGKPKVITFYSFKGGMGRSTTLASVALQLAQKGKNVMIVDMDIEAPGIATLFFDEESITNGVLDYLIEHNIQKEIDICNYIKDVTDPALLDEQYGRLYVMPAGKVNKYYIQKLARIDYQDHREGYLRKSMCDMLYAIKNSYDVDYILIDSHAGFHDLGGIAVAQLPHGSVLFGNNSRQSWDGMTQVIRTISQSRGDNPQILIVDCMCDSSTSPLFGMEKEQFTAKSHTVCVENYYNEDEPMPGKDAANEPHSPVFLPYDEALRREIILYSTGKTEENERVKAFAKRLHEEAYKNVTARIEAWFGEGDNI